MLDPNGNSTQRTVSGVEAGGAFSFTTTTTYTASGQPSTLDPPGFGTADVTSFTYDPLRGDLFTATRTDPLVGTTSFAYDPLNRRTSTTDPNGVETTTAYDTMDRVTLVTQKGAPGSGTGEDLVTENEYNVFGNLERTILPEGNVIEYEYDATGRLTAIARGSSPGVLLERTVYELDSSGNRTQEQLQRWSGTAWETTSETSFVYSTRCQLDRIVRAPGTPEESVTEYGYDCNGNLESVWDANHSSAADPPTQSYAYDALDRLTSISQPWAGSGGGTAVTTYGYDVQDHLTAVTDAEGNTTAYTYSDRDLLTEQVSPVSGTSSFAYNEHGELTQETDGRGVVTTRTVDALDRVTFLDTPENALDTTYTYDDPAVVFSNGRLTAITRNGRSIDYVYDRFGRTTQDGDLAFTYDKNGNRTGITYPNGVTATTTHDFADREETLTVQDGASTTSVVSSAGYLPSGPLNALAFGNGTTESRTFDSRYFPTGITAGSLLDWTYSTDSVGNILQIADSGPGPDRTYTYQDTHYFLTSGSGPWGDLSWSYDKIGNRLTETRGSGTGVVTNYAYTPSATGGRSPKLSAVGLGTEEEERFFFDAAGNETYKGAATEKHRMSYDALSRMSQITTDSNQTAGSLLTLSYDGRSFLREASRSPFPGSPTTVTTNPTYSSDGLLMHKATTETLGPEDPRGEGTAVADSYVFYFAGRPVGILENQTVTPLGGAPASSSALTYLTADHLGTPVLATDDAGTTTWAGGFEPFGEDWQMGTSGASAAGVFLRFPGQWEDAAWSGEGTGDEAGFYYNVHRWYEPTTGRYGRVDPLGFDGSPHLYSYSLSNPLVVIDPQGSRITHVDPGLEDTFNCAIAGVPEFRDKALRWLVNDSTDWEIREHPRPEGNPEPLPNYCKGSSCWERPGPFGGPGKAWVIPTSDCETQMESLMHELLEIYANRGLGLSTRGFNPPAHSYANKKDRDFARQACCKCE